MSAPRGARVLAEASGGNRTTWIRCGVDLVYQSRFRWLGWQQTDAPLFCRASKLFLAEPGTALVTANAEASELKSAADDKFVRKDFENHFGNGIPLIEGKPKSC